MIRVIKFLAFTIGILLLPISVSAETSLLNDSLPLGDRHRIRGEFEEAIGSYQRSAEADRAGKNVRGEARALVGLGNVYYIKARYLDAIGSFRRAESLADSAGDEVTAALARAYIGQFYWRVGNREAGEMYLNDALRVLESSDERLGYALALRFMGRLEAGRERIGNDISANLRAIALFEKSISICREIENIECDLTATKDLGQVYLNHRFTPEDFATARKFFDNALQRLKGTDHIWLYAVVLNNLATNAYRQKDLDDANKFTNEAIEIFRRIDDRQELREVLYTKSLIIFAENKNIERAEPFINESVQIARELYSQFYGDGVARQRYFESIAFGYMARESYYYRRGQYDKLLETLESFRSWALLEALDNRDRVAQYSPEERKIEKQMLAAASPENTAGKSTSLRKRLLYEEWKAKIDSKYRQTSPSVLGAEVPVSDLCKALPNERTAILRYHNIKYSPISLFILTKAKVDVTGIRETLPTDDLASKQFAMEDGSVCSMVYYYVSPWRTLEEEARTAQLHNKIIEFETQVSRASPAFKANAKLLYQKLLSHADKVIKNVDHLVFITGGNVARVPFQALIDSQDKFVIESRSVSYAPSITALSLMQARKGNTSKNGSEYLGIGNASYTANGLAPLPETGVEVSEAGRMFANSVVLTGANASLDGWRKNAVGKRTIHFALHGSSDKAQPMYSYLALSPTNYDDDGVLTAAEIAGMKLDADLVILSACETAYGKELDGEGIVGLTWAFAAAGVPTIIATSWRIDSTTTRHIVRDFHTGKRNGVSAAVSLRNSSIVRIRNRATYHPFYWAGFSLTGAW